MPTFRFPARTRAEGSAHALARGMSLVATAVLAYAGLSSATFALYGWDKLRAKRGARRVPEARLHGLALLGGFAGAWLGRLAFRHKTQKPVFTLVLGAAALLHAAAWGWWLWL